MEVPYDANRVVYRLNRELSVLKLGAHCPYDHTTPSFCPLAAVRQIGPSDRLNWIHSLSDADLEYLTNYHQICMLWRSVADSYQPLSVTPPESRT